MLVRKPFSLVVALLLLAVACGGSSQNLDDLILRPKGCEAESGSPTDLDAEPAHWLRSGNRLRWTDAKGCPVRVDVISHIRGAEHCGWEEAQFITIGRPLGSSVAGGLSPETANRYVWDPSGILPGGPFGTVVSRADLPSTTHDTGFRQDGAELWLDEADESVLHRVTGNQAQIWVRDFEVGICA